jgi:hypothetical protein
MSHIRPLIKKNIKRAIATGQPAFLMTPLNPDSRKICIYLFTPKRIKKFRPISRILYCNKLQPLSFIWSDSHLPDLAAYPPASDEQPLTPHLAECTGVHGISTHEVYPACLVAKTAVGSYPTISPLPDNQKRPSGGIFSVALAVALPSPTIPLPVRKHGALRCPDFPPLIQMRRDKAA